MGVPNSAQIGDLFIEEGGYVAGFFAAAGDGIATHAIMLPPAECGRVGGIVQGTPTSAIATSTFDGAANHAEIVANGETYGPVDWIEANLNNVSYLGFDDWFLPSRAQLDIIFWNLKPSDDSNNTADQFSNPYAVPQRGEDRTVSVPGETQVSIYKEGASDQEFDETIYWTSTRDQANTGSYTQNFGGANSGQQIIQTSPNLNALVAAIRLSPLVTPPTIQAEFETTYADVSGRDPLPTALTQRTPAQRLVNYLVSLYAGTNPRIVRKPVEIEPGELRKTSPAPASGDLSRQIWIEDHRDPNFFGGRWATILGRSGGSDPGTVELTLFIADNPESFVEPT